MSLRSVLAAVLALEALTVLLAIPVAVVADGRGGTAAAAAAGIALLALAAAGLLRRSPRAGTVLGWAVQLLLLAFGLVVVPFVFLGVVFTALWAASLYYGHRAERIHEARFGGHDGSAGRGPAG